MFYVYVVFNKKVNKFYIGQTENLAERVRFHNNKFFKGSYTSRFDGAWELVYSEVYSNRVDAVKREKQLKSFRGRQFVKQHIPG